MVLGYYEKMEINDSFPISTFYKGTTKFLQDFIHNEEWILGVYEGCEEEKRNHFVSVMSRLFETAFEERCITSKNIKFVTAREAEMVKMFRNCFLAIKVSFCNEIYQYCKKTNVN